MKTLKEKIEVMQAALDGKKVERYVGVSFGWVVLTNPCEVEYDWCNQKYRVKPEPLELWVNVVDDYTSSINWTTEKEALENCVSGARTVRMVQADE